MNAKSEGGRAAALLRAMADRHVLVVGDLFLDEYWVGRAERLSREGPVPVLAFSHRFCLPGGAANPAHNIVRLGSAATQIGLVGDDATGEELRRALDGRGIAGEGLVLDPTRPTTRKTRIVAEGLSAPQQVARIDRIDRAPARGAAEEALVRAIESQVSACDAVLVSHYCSGVVTPRVARAAVSAAQASGAVLAVDAQGDLERFVGFDLVRVGRADAAEHLGVPLETEIDYHRAAADLRSRLGTGAVLLGRGAAGASVADDEGYEVVPAAQVSEVYDVAGAGDTVIAVVTLALAAGASVREAVGLAHRAAGIVVRRLGVAAPSPEEILETFGEARPPADGVARGPSDLGRESAGVPRAFDDDGSVR